MDNDIFLSPLLQYEDILKVWSLDITRYTLIDHRIRQLVRGPQRFNGREEVRVRTAGSDSDLPTMK